MLEIEIEAKPTKKKHTPGMMKSLGTSRIAASVVKQTKWKVADDETQSSAVGLLSYPISNYYYFSIL